MPIANAELLKVRQEFTMPGNVEGLNVFYATRNDANPGFLDDSLALEMLGDGLIDFYLPILPLFVTGVVIDRYLVDKLVWSVPEQKWITTENIGEGAIGFAGTSLGDMLPQQMCGVITATCSKVRCRPKKFLGGFDEAVQADGIITGVDLGLMTSAATAWLTPMTSLGFVLDWVTGANDGTIQQLNTAVANAIMGTQRRRKIGVGQ